MNSQIYELNKDVVFVHGAVRGAIYNFNDGNVYSVNEDACLLIDNYIENHKINSAYLIKLEKTDLISSLFNPKIFSIPDIEPELLFVWLEITEACNLRCIHCYDGDEHRNCENALTFEDWKKIIIDLHKVGCKSIEFIGGEPSIYPKFLDLMKFAISIGQKIEIYSNLSFFSDEIVDFIKKNDITVHFSIYGSNENVHDSITTVRGSFEKTLLWVQKMKNLGINLIPAATILNQNKENISELEKFMEKLGLPIKLDTIRVSSKRNLLNLYPTGNIVKKVFRVKPNFKANKRYFNFAAKVNTCLFGKFSIQPNGNISPCEFSRDIILGNVKTTPFEEIIKSEELKRFWYMDFSKIEDCNCCEYRFACKDCRFSSEKRKSKSSRCLYNPKSGEWMEFSPMN